MARAARRVRTQERPCSHVAPQSCRECDGTAAEDREFYAASPAQRRAYLRGLREWRERFQGDH